MNGGRAVDSIQQQRQELAVARVEMQTERALMQIAHTKQVRLLCIEDRANYDLMP